MTSPVVGPSLISATGPEIWIYDLNRNALERITFAPGEEEVAVWSPDGKPIAYPMYPTVEKQAFWVPRDGSAAEQQLKTMPVQTASGRFGGDVVEGRPACGEDTSVST